MHIQFYFQLVLGDHQEVLKAKTRDKKFNSLQKNKILSKINISFLGEKKEQKHCLNFNCNGNASSWPLMNTFKLDFALCHRYRRNVSKQIIMATNPTKFCQKLVLKKSPVYGHHNMISLKTSPTSKKWNLPQPIMSSPFLISKSSTNCSAFS